jgi:hypothetical protein
VVKNYLLLDHYEDTYSMYPAGTMFTKTPEGLLCYNVKWKLGKPIAAVKIDIGRR